MDRDAVLRTLETVTGETIAPAATQVDYAREFPRANLEALRASQLLQVAVPRALGGSGANVHDDIRLLFEVIMQLGSACVSTAQIVGVHLVAESILALLGDEEQQARFWKQEIDDKLLWAMWASEPGTGAIRVKLETAARRVEGGYVISGKKHYATNSLGADWIQLYVQREGMSLAEGMVLVAVPTADPGVTIIDDWDAMGQRGTASGTAVFDAVFVPDANVLAAEAEFFGPQVIGSTFQTMFSAIYVGAAEGALGIASDYLATRARPTAQYPRRIDDPVLQHQFGGLSARTYAARCATLAAADALQGVVTGDVAYGEASVRAAQAGVVATSTANEVVDEVFRLVGSGAARRVEGRSLPLEVFLRNTRLLTLQGSVDEKQVLVGRSRLGVGQPVPTLST